MELYRKFRPNRWDQIFGQDDVVRLCRQLIKKNSVPHVFLASGPSGCGKTTILRLLAAKLGATEDDIIDHNCADNRGIDDIRDIRRRVNVKSFGTCRVWILDEAHQLPNTSQSLLLKLLEEASETNYFMLATTDPQRLLKTIRTRCQKLRLKLLDDPTMEKMLIDVCQRAKIKISDDVREKIVSHAEGSAREAMEILHAVSVLDGEDDQLEAIEKTSTERDAGELARAMLYGTPAWSDLMKIIDGIKDDSEAIRRRVVAYVGKVIKGGGKQQFRAYQIMRSFSKPFYNSGDADLVASCFEVVCLSSKK